MTNLILIDRKNKKHVVCETRHVGAEVQLPPAGTGPASASATGARWAGEMAMLYVSTDPLARRGLWHRATNSMSRERLVLAPGINKPQGGAEGQLAGFIPRRSQVQILPLQSSRREALGFIERENSATLIRCGFMYALPRSQTGNEKKSALPASGSWKTSTLPP